MKIGTKLRYTGTTYQVVAIHEEYLWVKHLYSQEYKTIHRDEVLFADEVEVPKSGEDLTP